MDTADVWFFLMPEVLVFFVGLCLIIVFGKEFMENRRAVQVGKDGTRTAPVNYWGRYQANVEEKDTVHISSVESRD